MVVELQLGLQMEVLMEKLRAVLLLDSSRDSTKEIRMDSLFLMLEMLLAPMLVKLYMLFW